MPTLAPEPAVFPEGLLESLNPAAYGDRIWWVLHTRPRQEKCLARQFYQAQLAYYLPLIPHRRRQRGRLTTSYIPLFAGYIFLLGTPEERLQALAMSSRRVARSLRTVDQERMWRDLNQVSRVIASGESITREGRLVPGALVQICSGPLAGLEGVIIRTASGRRFVVRVDFIQQGASVELDDYTLVKIGTADTVL